MKTAQSKTFEYDGGKYLKIRWDSDGKYEIEMFSPACGYGLHETPEMKMTVSTGAAGFRTFANVMLAAVDNATT